MKYLSPKADLTFKRVFGEHPDIVTSFLNAMLPLKEGEEIEEVEYLPSELVPKNPMRKNTIVDVRCKDKRGRQFLVEMQMIWSEEFKTRVLFNASKAYVRQLDAGERYELLQPVYSLNLVNDVFEPEWKDEYYHHYRIVNVEHSERVIDGLQLVFIELPKFTPNTYTEKKAQTLWLRFLNEINEKTKEVPSGLLDVPAISKAVRIVEESAYTDAQLQGYEDFWDGVSVERTLVSSALRKGHKKGFEQGMKEGLEAGMEKGMEQGLQAGMEQGLQAGMEQGLQAGMEKGMEKGLQAGMEKGLQAGMEKGMEKGRRDNSLDIAREMKASGMALELIAQFTKLSIDEIGLL